MKIIKGKFKGRNLVSADNTRPVSSLVRKACFDILGDQVIEKNILDLFAGTGALGLEALSLGAKTVVFNDHDKKSIQAINNNIKVLNLLKDFTQVHCKDAFAAIYDFFQQDKVFDIIFLDPPYYQGLMKKILQALEEYDILTPYCYIVGFCYVKDDINSILTLTKGPIELVVDKTYGQTRFLVYRRG